MRCLCKSTLIRCISGLEDIRAGDVSIVPALGNQFVYMLKNVMFGLSYWYGGAYPQGQRTSGDGISSPGDLHNFGTGIPSANLSDVGFFPLARVPYAKR